jgi:hypothetical protein
MDTGDSANPLWGSQMAPVAVYDVPQADEVQGEG